MHLFFVTLACYLLSNHVEAAPQFEEAAPQFADSRLVEYQRVRERVSTGERVTVYLDTPGITPGTYDCWLENGKPVMQLQSASEVRSSSTFPGIQLGNGCPPTG